MMLARAFQNAPIGRKIIAAFAVLVVLFGVLGSLAIVQFSHFNAIVDDLTKNYVSSLVELDDMRGNLAAFRVATLREQIAPEPSAAIRQQKDAELESMLAKIKAGEDRYTPTVTAGEERESTRSSRRPRRLPGPFGQVPRPAARRQMGRGGKLLQQGFRSDRRQS